MPSEIKTVGGFDDHLLYSIRNDPFKVREFETYGKTWIPLVNKLGGTHHGYYLPREGSDTVAVAMFSFPLLAAYENYRTAAASNPECQKAVAYHRDTRCFLKFERSLMRPVLGREQRARDVRTAKDGVIGRPSLWIAEDFGCCASG
jgi:hypothetical protein